MAFLALSNDELALLRFTCDLFFVKESPLWFIEESAPEPKDYDATYKSLVERTVIDPHEFKMTDSALNRTAPVTECDARIVQITRAADGTSRQVHRFLMDEIAVSYERLGDKHLFGDDLDTDELVEALARELLPRRAGGDLLDVVLTALEMAALSIVLGEVRVHGREVPIDALKAAFKKPPDEAMLQPAALLPHTVVTRRPTRARAGALLDDARWDDALRGVVEKGAARVVTSTGKVSLWVHASLVDLATRDASERHTFVRTDFGEDEWFVRETTFIPVEGSLWWTGARKGGIGLEELDGTRLRRALLEAVGPFSSRRAVVGQKVTDLGVRPDPVKA